MNGGNEVKWSKYNNRLHNSEQQTATVTTSGKVWTWESYNSLGNGNMVKAEDKENFPAFYYAGNFYASSDLTSRLQGKPLAHSLQQPGVWYLGSASEWIEVGLNIGFADPNELNFDAYMPASWNMILAPYAFTAAFNPAYSMLNSNYWTSSEYTMSSCCGIWAGNSDIGPFSDTKYVENRVRAFVSF